MARYGFSPPTRIFEAAGAGACIISDAWEGIGSFLEPDREILLAQSGDAVIEILERTDTLARRKIAQAARSRILSSHTYAHRARQVTQLLDALGKRTEAA